MTDPADFVGAKAALCCDGLILTYLRDDKPGLPWPAFWDLPGGAREGAETPEECLFREVEEEFNLTLAQGHLHWRGRFPSMLWPDRSAVFFGGQLSPAEVAAIRFGDEGQCWRMMPLAEWLSHPQGIPEMQRRSAFAFQQMASVRLG